MCVVSMIGDHYRDKNWPGIGQLPPASPYPVIIQQPSEISRAEFDALKCDVLEMKELLKKAKAYDERNNEPDCEMETKMNVLRQIAKLVGVNLDDVLGAPPSTPQAEGKDTA